VVVVEANILTNKREDVCPSRAGCFGQIGSLTATTEKSDSSSVNATMLLNHKGQAIYSTEYAMLCEYCARIPLDLFLPKDASSRRFKDGKAWKLAVVYREGPDRVEDLCASATAGCPLCKIFAAALEAAEPLWAIGGEFTSRGHNMVLRSEPLRHPREREVPQEGQERITLSVWNEGEMTIADGRRTGGLYWELPSFGYGQRLGEWMAMREGASTSLQG
jgi:hypothetical protein